ncbi:TonB-dependent receptor [Galbibacter sp. EGI 63066]|uniref:SusC/RagA family TonB-linked outer membrane protein n=1 Tax=Galbibacter sp. EGI 63066 TaxID=2993559 RepID=UPI00224945E5|nr:TonB-dependent receptor [Galbibacter sp. EGI 63066]MCX2680463.1 TonB-dependent receptor [Galbibacter sp. EGI 63066]
MKRTNKLMKMKSLVEIRWIRIFIMALFFIPLVGVQAQQSQSVTGVVTSASSGEPLPGVNVIVKGTSIGIATDFDGKYTIQASQGDVLVYSYIGFKTLEATVGSSTTVNVSLEEDFASLDEVVVIGYGSQRKSDLTGSVSVVDVEDAKKTVTYDVAKMLQGQAPGVTVQSSGEPGGFVNIKIRGITSFANNNPLFVIDGVIVDDPYDFATGEIESIQVLKDASSAAIYGARGANGVVIITTKKGREGKIGITYKSMTGMQNVPKKLSLVNREQYQEITNVAETNAGIAIAPANDPTSENYVSNIDTDWQDAAFRTAMVENQSLTFTGGAKAMNYSLNMDYFKNTSYFKTPQAYTRLSTNLNLGGEKGKFKYGAKISYTQSDKENFNEYNEGTSSVINLLQNIPTIPVYDETHLGGYGGPDQLIHKAITLNVIGFNNLITNENLRNRFLGNVWGEYEIVKGLKYKLNVSADRLDWGTRYFIPPSYLDWYHRTTNDEASLDVTSGNLKRTIVNNTLSYQTVLGDKHNIDVLLGWLQERSDYYNHVSRGVGYGDLAIPKLQYADNRDASENESAEVYLSYISRLNYSFDDRYFLTANFRQDKSSLFAPNNNTGNYFSVSGAWKLHNENFINLPEWWNTLKLRGGYGQLGNNTISPYQFYTTVNSFAHATFGGELAQGTTALEIKDADIKWEDTESTNVAVETSFFNNSLEFSAEYFVKKSIDLLANFPLPFSTGAIDPEDWANPSVTTNAATVRNTGLEFALTYRNYKKQDFGYSISANVGTLKNEVLKIGEDGRPIPGAAARTAVGRSAGEIYGYVTDGIFQNQEEIDTHADQPDAAPGDIRFKDLNNDGLITDDDRTFLGGTIPKVSYGLNFSANYKDFDFSFFFQGAAGHKIFNATYRAVMIGDYTNHHTDMLNYWTPENTNTNIPRPVIGDPNSNQRDSDRWVENGDFLKLQNIQLGYNIPVENTKFFSGARVYVSGQNLFVLTDGFKGYDPDFMSDGLFSRGFYNGSFPNPRTLALGLEVKF